MLTLVKRINQGTPTLFLELPLEKRVKARFKAQLTNGCAVGILLDRGPILRGGDLLATDTGTVVQVNSAPEQVTLIQTEDAHLLLRAAYHLGNRHVPLQVLPQALRYQQDHVLDQMVRGLGITPCHAELPFEPEPGAYGEHGSEHAHGHSHHHAH